MWNISKLQFFSGYPIDKIVVQNSTTMSVPASADNVTPSVATTTVPNPYNKASFVTLSFSLDNTNFYNQNSEIPYWSTTFLETLNQMSVTAACSDSTIFFLATSLYTIGTQNVFINYTLDTIT